MSPSLARVVEGGVDVAVLFPPRAGACVQRRLDRRVEAIELATEHVPEEVVVAVPLAASIERDEEQVRSVDLFEHSSRVGALEDIVTHPCRQAIEHRRPNQELPELSRKRARLRRAGSRRPGGRGPRNVRRRQQALGEPQRDRGEIEAAGQPSIWTTRTRAPGRRALRPRGRGASGLPARSSRGCPARCGGAHRCAHAREREEVAPTGEHELRAERHLVRQPLEHGDRSGRVQQVDVVEHEHERQRPVGEHVAEAGRRMLTRSASDIASAANVCGSSA